MHGANKHSPNNNLLAFSNKLLNEFHSCKKLGCHHRVYTGIKILGDVSIPLLLFSLGVRLTDSAAKDVKLGLVGAALCPLAGMGIAWTIAPLLGLDTMQRGMLLIFGALPPAVLNYIFAEKYRQEPERVASIVMIGNMASLLFIPLALFFALPR